MCANVISQVKTYGTDHQTKKTKMVTIAGMKVTKNSRFALNLTEQVVHLRRNLLLFEEVHFGPVRTSA